MRSALVTRLSILCVALGALAWFWPVLGHGFRSDDFLTVYYWDRDGEAVRWGRVFEEWVRPWFGVRDLYRPWISLSYGANYALSVSPFGFHALNVALLCGTAACVAALAARLAAGARTAAAVVAGLAVVLHPAAVEPTAWIAARTTGFQVFFSALAYWGFVRWRDGEGRRWLPLVAVVLACASKEGAVLLPFSLLLLDLVRGGRPAVRVHWPFFALAGGYLLYRRALLGVFTTAEEGHTAFERLVGAWHLLQQLVSPPGGVGVWLAAAIVLGLCAALRRGPRALWGVLWMFVLLTPGTTHVKGAAGDLAGRFVFDAVPASALLLGLGAGAMRGAIPRASAIAVAAAVLVGLGLGSRHWLARYGDDDATIRAAQRELTAAAKDAAPGKPYGVIGLPGLPLLQPEAWGLLALRPFAERDLPVVGLTNILTRNPATPELFGDASPVHLLVANGAGVGMWDEKTRRLVPVAQAAPGTVDFAPDPRDPRRYLPPRLLPPTAVAQLEIRSPTPVAEWRVEILGNLAGDYAAAPMAAVAPAGTAVAWCDTVHVLPWLVAATFGGGPAGIVLQPAGQEAPPPAGTIVRAHARLGALPLPPPPAGPVARAGLAAAIAPAGPLAAGLRRYLLLPTGAWSWRGPAGSTDMPQAIRDQVAFAADVLGGAPAHWCCVEEAVPGAAVRATGFASVLVR